MTEYLTIKQAAERLAVNHNTIRRMLPRLGAVDIAEKTARKRLIRIPVDALEGFLRGCEILPQVTIKSRPQKEFFLERRHA